MRYNIYSTPKVPTWIGMTADSANGKFLKGPNYWKPEPKIKALLDARGVRAAT